MNNLFSEIEKGSNSIKGIVKESSSIPAVNSTVPAPAPEVSVPDVSVPDVSVPVPDVSVPDVSVPDVSVPDVSVPDVSVPDVSVPDVSVPDVSVPDVSVPDVSAPVPKVKVPAPKVDVSDVSETISEDTDIITLDDISDWFQELNIPSELLIVIGVLLSIVIYGFYKNRDRIIEYFNDDYDYYSFSKSYGITNENEDLDIAINYPDLDIIPFDSIDKKRINKSMITKILNNPRSKNFLNDVMKNGVDNLAIYMNHMGIYQNFLETDGSYCIVIEKNMNFETKQFKTDINKLIRDIPSDWDILLFGYNSLNTEGKELNNGIYENIIEFSGLNGYIVTRKCCEMFMKQLSKPIWYLDWNITEMAKNTIIKVYASQTKLVS